MLITRDFQSLEDSTVILCTLPFLHHDMNFEIFIQFSHFGG